MPSGTTAQRPGSSLHHGHLRFNTDAYMLLRYYDGTAWGKVVAVVPHLGSYLADILVARITALALNLILAGQDFLSSIS